MRQQAFLWVGFLVCSTVVVSGFGQEGHPLTGTWSGDWGPSLDERTHLTIILQWEGEHVAGSILQGLDFIPIENLALDVTNWTVRFEASVEDESGGQVQIAAEGRLEDIGSAHRTITGTWRQGASEGDFRITRD